MKDIRIRPIRSIRPSRSGASPNVSRSSVRDTYLDHDPILRDLSPGRTLKALTASSKGSIDSPGKFDPREKQLHTDLDDGECFETGKSGFAEQHDPLFRSMEGLSSLERNLELRVVIAATKLREWHEEVKSWPWPDSRQAALGKGFITDLASASKEGDVVWLGGLPETVVKNHERRVEEIRDGMEDLALEDLKKYVLDAHNSYGSAHLSQDVEKAVSSAYNHLSDFTTIITATLLQALPYISKLTAILHAWDMRITVLCQLPAMLSSLENAKKDIFFALDQLSIGLLPFCSDVNFSRSEFEKVRDTLAGRVCDVGHKMDRLLNTLEGSYDCLPSFWIDDLDVLENDFASWCVEAEKMCMEHEWFGQAEANNFVSASFVFDHESSKGLHEWEQHAIPKAIADPPSPREYWSTDSDNEDDVLSEKPNEVSDLHLLESPMATGITNKSVKATDRHTLDRFNGTSTSNLSKRAMSLPLSRFIDEQMDPGQESQQRHGHEFNIGGPVMSDAPSKLKTIEEADPFFKTSSRQLPRPILRRSRSASAIDRAFYIQPFDIQDPFLDEDSASVSPESEISEDDSLRPVSPSRSAPDLQIKKRRPPVKPVKAKKESRPVLTIRHAKSHGQLRRHRTMETKINSILSTLSFKIQLQATSPENESSRAKSRSRSRAPKSRTGPPSRPSTPSPPLPGDNTATSPLLPSSEAFILTPAQGMRRKPSNISLNGDYLSRNFNSSHAASKTARDVLDSDDNSAYRFHLYHPENGRGGHRIPHKFLIRAVGDSSDRIMVRVGGGWVDLGQYLMEYVLWRGRGGPNVLDARNKRSQKQDTRPQSANGQQARLDSGIGFEAGHDDGPASKSRSPSPSRAKLGHTTLSNSLHSRRQRKLAKRDHNALPSLTAANLTKVPGHAHSKALHSPSAGPGANHFLNRRLSISSHNSVSTTATAAFSTSSILHHPIFSNNGNSIFASARPDSSRSAATMPSQFYPLNAATQNLQQYPRTRSLSQDHLGVHSSADLIPPLPHIPSFAGSRPTNGISHSQTLPHNFNHTFYAAGGGSSLTSHLQDMLGGRAWPRRRTMSATHFTDPTEVAEVAEDSESVTPEYTTEAHGVHDNDHANTSANGEDSTKRSFNEIDQFNKRFFLRKVSGGRQFS